MLKSFKIILITKFFKFIFKKNLKAIKKVFNLLKFLIIVDYKKLLFTIKMCQKNNNLTTTYSYNFEFTYIYSNYFFNLKSFYSF